MDEALRSLLYSLQHNGIGDPRVLSAIARIPRELFISEDALKAQAYTDQALPIECDQTISQPYIVAYMSERLNVAADQDVLEIGTGSGYQTAILSQLARHVYTMERHRELHELAVQRFERLGMHNITAIVGDGTEGWPDKGLFDRIIVTAGTRQVPDALLDQLSPCGSMLLPLGPRYDQRITLITRMNEHLEYQTLIPVQFVPLVPRDH
ncbi:MAG TPA: protein-L-isoaspartate(D-aspartate) O-methyltransferase [Geobacterales bacterium]|nr:protein-L-isoaspartate(D-aspartate) O-methyltransferase [Geobacterales bacterium]